MPIRTSRGRAGVYRAVWGWPLRSPVHLVAAVAVALAAGALVGVALPSDPPVPRVTGTAAAANPFDPAARTSPVEETPRAPAQALAVADSWVRAFLTTPEGIAPAQWVEQLRPYSTDSAVADLRTVDPANLPDGQVTGPPRTVSVRIGSAELDVPTSVAVVRVRLVTTADGWRVAGYDQAG